MMTNYDFIKRLLTLMAEYELWGDERIWWKRDLIFYANCNDLFHWGESFAVEIDEARLPALAQALRDAGPEDGPLLYCCRHERMRPQGAMYSYIEKEHWPLFDACGPERETGYGNPCRPGEYKPHEAKA